MLETNDTPRKIKILFDVSLLDRMKNELLELNIRAFRDYLQGRNKEK